LSTGYKYHFPFLDPKIGLEVDEDERVAPLYKHIFHTEFTTLSFIGLCKTVCPFPHFHVQMSTVLSVALGSAQLPVESEMKKNADDDLAARMSRGMPRRYAHLMGPLQWQYHDQLIEVGKFQDPIPQGVKDMYDYIHNTRIANLMGYKLETYELIGKDSFRMVK